MGAICLTESDERVRPRAALKSASDERPKHCSTALHYTELLVLEHGAKKSVAVHRKQQHVCGHQCAPGYVRQGASFPCWSCWAVRKSGRRRRRGRASSVPTLSRSPTGFSSGDDGCHQSTLHFYILHCTSWCMIRI